MGHVGWKWWRVGCVDCNDGFFGSGESLVLLEDTVLLEEN